MAYDCIRLAWNSEDCLHAEIGCLASEFENEEDFLKGVLELIDEIAEEPEEFIENLVLDIDELKHRLSLVRKYALKVLAIPKEQRGKPEFV